MATRARTAVDRFKGRMIESHVGPSGNRMAFITIRAGENMVGWFPRGGDAVVTTITASCRDAAVVKQCLCAGGKSHRCVAGLTRRCGGNVR